MKRTKVFARTISAIWHGTHLIDNSYEFHNYMNCRIIPKLKRVTYETFDC